MKAERRLNIAQQAIELLDHEHAILMAGKTKELPQLSERKEALLQELLQEKQNLTPADLAKIDQRTQRNAPLFGAVLAAQKSVMDRLAEITKAQKTLGTYGADGTFHDKVAPGAKLEKRS